MLVTSSDVSQRVAWVDVTKGMSIVLVVLFHSTLVDAVPPESGPWWALNAVFSTLRMPMFFLASGLFAVSALERSWRELLTGRVLLLVYMYVLWLTLRQVYFGLLAGELDLTWQDYVLPDSDMWFLYVLAVFFVLGRGLRSARDSRVLPAAAVLSIAASAFAVQGDLHKFDDMAVYFVFFLAGSRWSPSIRRQAEQVTRARAFAACGAFLALTAAVTAVGLRDVPPFRSIMTVAALVAGVAIAVLLDGSRVGRLLAFVGRRSMPVYVLHMGFVRTMVDAAAARGWDVQAHVLGPLLLATAAVVASLGLHAATRSVPGLFDLPRWLSRRVSVPGRVPTTARRPEGRTSVPLAQG